MSARGRQRGGSHASFVPLSDGWQLLATAAGAIATPAALPEQGWLAASVPATAASVLQRHGLFSLDGPPRAFDAEDWWWSRRFTCSLEPGERALLRLDGLATIAEVWLDGALVARSQNMFRSHELALAAGEHELALCFRSLTAALRAKRPRPRWRVPMLEQQQLRWFRTTLLGRTPGWSPSVPAVGPWQTIGVEKRRDVGVTDVRLTTSVESEAAVVTLTCALDGSADVGLTRAELVLTRAGREWRAPLSATDAGLSGALRVAQPELWWPHTHGEPALYDARLELAAPGFAHQLELGKLGFRSLTLDDEGGDFALRVNGERVFCRGACWTPLDVVSLSSDRATLDAVLDRVVAAGMNMLRVGGTMVYESDDFYDACDERGLLLWQDFMFANMDYPEEESFRDDVRGEARQLLARLSARPSLAVLCGSSEVEQQAAMWGAPRELWRPALFHELLRDLARELCPEVPYWPSSAHGGAFPHQANVGTTSYYGVGAYLRPLEDARRSQVRFASECLAFANIPEPTGLPGGHALRVHHAAWKARSPRDLGAGWDFDDVRDHYLQQLFALEPLALRSSDHERYLALGALTSGEVMARVFAEWRRASSACRGGLIWFLKDLWPSAGWGILDANARPKPAYWLLRRALQPVSVALSDEGLNGVFAQLINDGAAARDVELEIACFKDAEVCLVRARKALRLEPRSALELPVAELLEGFSDLSYAYRFGPPSCDLIVATLVAQGEPLAQSYHFPLGLPNRLERDLGLSAELRRAGASQAELVLRSRRLAYAVHVELAGCEVEDNYFNVAPGDERRLRLRHQGAFEALRGSLRAHNWASSLQVSGKA